LLVLVDSTLTFFEECYCHKCVFLMLQAWKQWENSSMRLSASHIKEEENTENTKSLGICFK
jgi:hypothetical protein